MQLEGANTLYIFEGIIILFTTILYGLFMISNLKFIKLLVLFTLLLDITLILQIIVQGVRWHFTFLYLSGMVLTPILFIYLFKNTASLQASSYMYLKIGITLFIVITGSVMFAFPVPRLTAPEGKYSVGTTVFDVTDLSRIEAYVDTPNTPRKFMFQVWYPTNSNVSTPEEPWLFNGNAVTKGLAQLGNLPSFALSQLSLVPSHAYFDAPMSDALETYPVIILSHGWSSSRLLHANMAESLASNGYIVIGIEHTYGSVATAFTDGSVAYFSEKTLPSTDYAQAFLENGNKLIKTFAGDISYVLNQLEAYNMGQSGPEVLKGHLDLDKIGLLGHSTGGGAAVFLGITDERIKSILAYDPWVEPLEEDDINKGLTIPTLFFRSDEWKFGPNNKNLMQIIEKNKAETSLYQMEDTDHSDFTLMYLFSPLTKKLNMLGDVNGDQLSIFQGKTAVTFFNQTLLNIKEAPLAEQIEALIKRLF